MAPTDTRTTDGHEIASLAHDEQGLTIRWRDGAQTELTWLWIRDHSHDPATFHPVTRQREVFTAGIDAQPGAAAVSVVDRAVVVEWIGDEPDSVLPTELLAALGPPADEQRVLWDRATITEQWPVVDHDAVLNTDGGVREWLEFVARYGFCLVAGTPPTAEATRTLVERIGYVRHTIFGGFWEFQPDLSRDDTAYTTDALRPHTDGTYSHDAPGLQILHCLEHDGEGGESTMVDGFRLADELRRDAPTHYEVLSTVEVPGRYIGDGVHLTASRPVFRHDREGRLVQVSFNNADRAPFLLPPGEMTAFYDALRAFEHLVDDPDLRWERRNPPGEAMLFDNWRVLHGRRSFTGPRRLCGAYVNREDYESRRRTLRGARRSGGRQPTP